MTILIGGAVATGGGGTPSTPEIFTLADNSSGVIISDAYPNSSKIYIRPDLTGSDITFVSADNSINSTTTDFNTLLNNSQQTLSLSKVALSGATRSGSTATYTVEEAFHGYENGQLVTVSGFDQAEYNIVDTAITVISDNEFTATVAGTPVTPGTGSATVQSDHVFSSGAPLIGRELITITGTGSNNSTFTIASVAANKITVSEAIIDETPASATITADFRLGFEAGDIVLIDKSDIDNITANRVQFSPPDFFSFRSVRVGATVGPDFFIAPDLSVVEVDVRRRSPSQFRLYLSVGRIGLSQIGTTTPAAAPILYGDNMGGSVIDQLLLTGSTLNEGCAQSASATNPDRLAIASGSIFRWRVNAYNDRFNPNLVTVPADPEDVPFGYSTDGRGWYNPTNNPQSIPAIAAQEVDLLNYWDGNSLVAVPGGTPWHVQEVWYFAASNVSVIRYSQAVHANKILADAFLRDSHAVPDTALSVAKNAAFLGYIQINRAATDLSDAANVFFIPS